jgi:hypothetical protein
VVARDIRGAATDLPGKIVPIGRHSD